MTRRLRRPSLKAALVLWTTLAVAAVWLTTLAFSYFEARHEVDELLDGHLAQAAAVLALGSRHELDEVDTEHAPLLHKYARRVAFQVVGRDGQIGLHSSSAPNTPLASGRAGFSDSRVDGRRWRVFTTVEDGLTIHVGEDAEARAEVARALVGGMLIPLLLAVPALAIFLWIGVARGLKPLQRIAAEIDTRAPDNLAAIDTAAMPDEVRPLAERLNLLFAKLGRSLEAERRFTADAAHELRTPLAGIRAQAQVAQGADDPAQRQHALAAILNGCDRAARLVDQLLTLSRLDHGPAGESGPVALRTLAAEVLAEAADTAVRKSIDLGLDDGEEARIQGNADLLRILLRNLVDNALRYTPAGGRVTLSIRPEADAAVIRLQDSGPGIPEDERERALERFYRGLGSGKEGSGLGLSIVARIAQLHGCEPALSAPPDGSGLIVTLRIPARGRRVP